jgi:hypothetical protein
MGWRALAENRLGRTPSFVIRLEIFIFVSLKLSLLLDNFMITSSVTLPVVTAKYPQAQRSCPQNAFFNMDMVTAHMPVDNFYIHTLAYLPDQFSQPPPYILVEDQLAVLRDPHNVMLDTVYSM